MAVHADFVDFPGDSNAREVTAARLILAAGAQQLFDGATKHGANQEVFLYQVVEPSGRFRCLIRLRFYGGCTATAFFGEIVSRGG